MIEKITQYRIRSAPEIENFSTLIPGMNRALKKGLEPFLITLILTIVPVQIIPGSLFIFPRKGILLLKYQRTLRTKEE
jgi:hypothetical protein